MKCLLEFNPEHQDTIRNDLFRLIYFDRRWFLIDDYQYGWSRGASGRITLSGFLCLREIPDAQLSTAFQLYDKVG